MVFVRRLFSLSKNLKKKSTDNLNHQDQYNHLNFKTMQSSSCKAVGRL